MEAFHSTLEEAREADILLQVVDYSDPHYKEQIAVTNQTLKELGADGIPMIYVYNKADKVSADDIPVASGRNPGQRDNQAQLRQTAALCETGTLHKLPVVTENSIYLSAKQQIGMEALICLIEKKLSGGYQECTLLIPYTDGRAVSYLNEHAVVYETAYLEEGVQMKLNCRKEDYRYYEKYIIRS